MSDLPGGRIFQSHHPKRNQNHDTSCWAVAKSKHCNQIIDDLERKSNLISLIKCICSIRVPGVHNQVCWPSQLGAKVSVCSLCTMTTSVPEVKQNKCCSCYNMYCFGWLVNDHRIVFLLCNKIQFLPQTESSYFKYSQILFLFCHNNTPLSSCLVRIHLFTFLDLYWNVSKPSLFKSR